MKKILEVGKIFKARCPKCNCLFQYEKEDIQVEKLCNNEHSVITCPQCGKEISTPGRLDIAIDNAADMRMPIKNTIDIAIKKVTE